MITILIADDHPVVRTGLQGMLASQADFRVVGEAANGAEAITLAAELCPGVVLMDLRMPVVDGVDATAEICAAQPEVHVLVLTTYDSDSDIVRAIAAGATGYLLKDTPRDTLFHAIRATARGETPLTPTVAARLLQHVRSPAVERLSEREVEVLGLVAHGASNKAIAHQLHLSQATVKSHLINIFGKLGVDDRTAAVTVAIQRGLLHL